MKKFLIAGVAVLALLAVPMIRTADLMPPELASGFTPEQAERGRALMDGLARTHGREAMESHQVLTLSLADEWFGLMGKGSNPFPVARQTFDVVLGTREWSGRFEMTNGPDDGVEWGMQNGRTYRRPPDGAFESPPAKELDSTLTASFMFPTLRYFLMLPVELGTAELVSALSPVEEEGRTFDRVYATWGSVEANPSYDQYIVWIDRETGRLDRVEYTVREMMKSARGLALYRDYMKVDGALLATRIRIHVVLPGGVTVGVHETTIEDPKFDDAALPRLHPLLE